MLFSHKGHNNTMQVYSVTVMTNVKALQAGQSSQGTSEPITPAAILDVRKSLSVAFLAISDQYAIFFTCFGTKWLPSAILDVRNSLWITFLAILDQYRFFIFLNNFLAKWLPVAIMDVRISLSISFLAISDRYATLIFWKFLTKWLPSAILDKYRFL